MLKFAVIVSCYTYMNILYFITYKYNIYLSYIIHRSSTAVSRSAWLASLLPRPVQRLMVRLGTDLTDTPTGDTEGATSGT